MIKTAKLNNLKFVTWEDNSPYFLTENDTLTVNLKSDIYSLLGAIVRFKNGKIVKDYTYQGTPISVDKSLIFEGKLDCLVTLKDNLKTFYLDGIKIKILDEQFVLESFFDELKKEIESQDKRITAIEEYIEDSKKTIFD